jgi:hypothetical protein
VAAPTTTASPPQGLCAYSRTAAAAAGKLRARSFTMDAAGPEGGLAARIGMQGSTNPSARRAIMPAKWRLAGGRWSRHIDAEQEMIVRAGRKGRSRTARALMASSCSWRWLRRKACDPDPAGNPRAGDHFPCVGNRLRRAMTLM